MLEGKWLFKRDWVIWSAASRLNSKATEFMHCFILVVVDFAILRLTEKQIKTKLKNSLKKSTRATETGKKKKKKTKTKKIKVSC